MPEPENTPQQVQYRQSVEQFASWLRDFAPLVGTYYKALKEQGVSDYVAAQLLIEAQKLVVPTRTT